MAKTSRSETPSLADLRREIDRIDETMHGLLMERGEIIDRLISVKQTQESGSAFRPAREAEMMRRLVEPPHGHPAARHRREHLARHHRDLHLRAGAVLRSRRPVGGRRGDARLRPLSFRLHGAVRSAYGRGERGGGGVRLQGRSRTGPGLRHGRRRRLVERARVRCGAEDHRAAAFRRARRPSGRRCRCSSFPAPPPTPWSRRSRSGACGWPAGARRRRKRSARSPR